MPLGASSAGNSHLHAAIGLRVVHAGDVAGYAVGLAPVAEPEVSRLIKDQIVGTAQRVSVVGPITSLNLPSASVTRCMEPPA